MQTNILSAMLGLHYNCQCSCEHCGIFNYKKSKIKNKTLNQKEILNIIDTLRKLQIKEVYFFGGEPLLEKYLTKYIAYAKNIGLFTRLDTNGLLLNKKNTVRLKKSGLDEIGISLDSPLEKKHDQGRGKKGLFKKAIAGILLCRAVGLPCYISHCVSAESINNKETEVLIKLANHLKVKVRLLLPALCGKLTNKTENLLNNSEMAIFKSYLKKDTVFWENSNNDQPNSKLICYAKTQQSFFISPYGDIQPCCYVPISFGNIRNNTLEEILEQMQKQNIFKSYTEGCLGNCTEIKQLTQNQEKSLPVLFKE